MNLHILRISAANIYIHCLVAEACIQKCSLSFGVLFECVVIEHYSSLRVEIIISGPHVENVSK